MGNLKIKELSELFIRKLESDIELTKRDRHIIALLLCAHTLPYCVNRKIVERKADSIDSDSEHLAAYEEFRKSFGHEDALFKTFGKRHKGDIKYMQAVITRARKYKKEMNQSQEEREFRMIDDFQFHAEILLGERILNILNNISL